MAFFVLSNKKGVAVKSLTYHKTDPGSKYVREKIVDEKDQIKGEKDERGNDSVEYLLGMTDDEYFGKSKNPIPFSERLEALCKETGLTVYQISQNSHIDRSNFLFWRRGIYLPSLEHLTLLAEYFEVSFDYILGRSDDK